jgi:hypothetical protein
VHTWVDSHYEDHLNMRRDLVCNCCGGGIGGDGDACPHTMLMDHLDDFEGFIYRPVWVNASTMRVWDEPVAS